ncbi:hypothetical protein RFM99_35415, partial [Mesorhizobium sp. VK4C]|uniref:hypothetical protein n=1 Tax=Mesorhizobium captivum TaxID=3072319 RepID=UPI002A23CB61
MLPFFASAGRRSSQATMPSSKPPESTMAATESHPIQMLQAIFRRRFFTLDHSTNQMCAHASPQGGEGKDATASKMTNNSLCLANKAFLSSRDRNRSI